MHSQTYKPTLNPADANGNAPGDDSSGGRFEGISWGATMDMTPAEHLRRIVYREVLD